MAKIVVVTSGKGGVGKTTTSASFASGLALRALHRAGLAVVEISTQEQTLEQVFLELTAGHHLATAGGD